MRSDLEDNKANQLRLFSGRFGTEKQALTGDLTFTKDTPVYNAFDPNGSNRIITLSGFERGRFFIIANEGTANYLTVKDSSGSTVVVVRSGELHLLACSGNQWTTNPGVFGVAGTGHSTGLVPDPGAVSGLARFLMDDGTWTSVTTAGIVDAYKQIYDGTNTAVASGLSQLRIRSSDSAITPIVTNNDPTYGDVLDLAVDESHVNHNILQNYVADEHVAHSGVSISAGTGLTGGGTIAASRTISLNITGLTVTTPELADELAVYDVSASAHRKITGTTLNAILDHNVLVNYSANRHIDHTAVSITGGTGLSGGGTIDSTRTISLDISGLSTDTPVAADKVLFYDVSGSDHNLTTFAVINGVLDHNLFLNYDANRHIDHTAVSISTTEGVQGGGTIAATRTLKLDISGLTADATPDSAADYVVTYDASAGLHKKVLLSNLPSTAFDLHGLAAMTTPINADELVLYDSGASANRKLTWANVKIALVPSAGMGAKWNYGLTATVATSALTVSVVDASGSVPSATSPAIANFRSPTLTTGTPVSRSTTAAETLIVPSGATLGFTNNTPGHLYVVEFDDAGTKRLGIYNASVSGIIYPLQASGIASSTAIDTASDNAGVFYTGTAISSKAYVVLGRLTWGATPLATAGTWANGPDIIELAGPGFKYPGDFIQSRSFGDAAFNAGGSTQIPFDNTKPQSGEGTQVYTGNIVPTSQANWLVHDDVIYVGTSAAAWLIAALFQDSNADATATGLNFTATANTMMPCPIKVAQLANTVSSTTFKIRIGGNSAATYSLNGVSAAGIMSGTLFSDFTVTEIQG